MPISEKRAIERHQVALVATIFYDAEPTGVKCCIRDANVGGCMLVSSLANEFPNAVEIVVDGLDARMQANIVWRSGKQAGAKFDWPAAKACEPKPDDWLNLGESTVLSE